MEISVVAPCLNERENVGELVRRTSVTLNHLAISSELVLIDDGSSDGTWQEIRGIVEAEPAVPITGQRHESNRGLEQAWRSGISMAKGRLICLIDSDLQNRPEDIAALYCAYRSSGADLVQAIRRPSQIDSRYIASRALNLLLNLSFGTTLGDAKSGFVLAPKEVLDAVLCHRFQYRYFQSFIGVSAANKGYRVEQVETRFDPRQRGVSFLGRFAVAPSILVFAELVKYRLETWLES